MNTAQPRKKTRPETLSSLRARLKEVTETLSAIRRGEVDALVVQSAGGDQVYTLETADHPYRILVQRMHEGALILGKEGIILYANPRFADLISTSSEHLVTMPFEAQLAPGHRDVFLAALARAAAGETTRLETILVTGPKNQIPVQIALSPLPIDSLETVCAIVADLRERKRNERMEQAAILARSLLDHATAAVFITDAEGSVIHANAAAEILAGGPMTSRRIADVLPLHLAGGSSQPASVAQLIRSAVQGTSTRNVEAWIGDQAAPATHVLVTVGPFRLGDDEISGAVFTCSDVTAMREAQRATQESEARFRMLAESLPQIVWTATKEGRINYYNSRAAEFFGRSVEELLIAGSDHIHPDDLGRVRRTWADAIEHGSPYEGEYRMSGENGEYRWFLSRAIPFRDALGRTVYWIGTSTDVDAQKRVEADLRQANSDLEQFAYAASHDFREPLRAVSTFTQLLREALPAHPDPSTSFYMEQIVEGSNRISALLDNLLTYIQATHEREGLGNVDCNEVLTEVLDNLRHQLNRSEAEVTWDPLPRFYGAHVHLIQVLQNLISNGIKYRGTEPPRVHVSAEEQRGEWVLTVADNGMGIAPEYHKQIFGVFKRLHGSKIPGTGMGLAICQRIVERHGGRIWVESALGQGSRFSFTISAMLHDASKGGSSAENVVKNFQTGAD